jgi:hypothetical protein
MKKSTFLLLFSVLLLSSSMSLYGQFTGSTALLVVADAANPTVAEQNITQRLLDVNFDVEIVGQADVTDASCDGMALVLISATVTSGTITTNMPGLATLPIPVIDWEPGIYDLLDFQAANGSEYGATDITIIKEDHPLAADMIEGPVNIVTTQKQLTYGTPQGDVTIIAINADADTQAVIFCYDKDAQMYTGTAPARRIGTFLLNDVADALTDEGWELFDAQVKWAMNAEATAVSERNLNAPAEFALRQNYPNPFNPETTISYSIDTPGFVQLKVFNAIGQVMATLANEIQQAGNHTATFNAVGLPSGLYICKLNAGSHSAINKMMLLK